MIREHANEDNEEDDDNGEAIVEEIVVGENEFIGGRGGPNIQVKGPS
jgi:hypothetical protein